MQLKFIITIKYLLFCVSVLLFMIGILKHGNAQAVKPNILFIVSDDQGYPHASAYGCQFVHTPTFDKIAEEGLLFTNFFVSAPQCSPSRASILTGRHIWQNGPAGTHWSTFPVNLTTYTDILEENGYEIGYTGKGWAPGNWIDGGRTKNPTGIKYVDRENNKEYAEGRPATGISKENYAGSFEMFLNKKEKDKPFCFWMGGWEPHLPYEWGSGLKNGKELSSVFVPPYLPNVDTVRSDLLDYAIEIEWFDKQAGKAIQMLKEREILDNTLIIFTSDNGMPFPRAKAFSFDMGNHVPFAMMWKGHIKNPGRTVDDLTSAIDLFPTFLEAADLKNKIPKTVQGKSLFDFFDNMINNDIQREYIYWGRERHGNARWDNLGYPQRAVRSNNYLFIWNPEPNRYPAGSPKRIGKGNELAWSFGDIGATPTKDYMIRHKGPLFQLTFNKFPEEMLFDIKKDPYCMNNLVKDSAHQNIKEKLSTILKTKLKETNDPRVGRHPNIWESYRRYGPMHQFPRPDWADSTLKKSEIRD